jgi:putative GTP pyrophosphokinase
LDEEMSKIKHEIIDAQEIFMIRSSLIAKILKKIQFLYFSGNIEKEKLKKLQEEFYLYRENGSIEDLRNLNRRLEELNQKYYIND